MVVELRALLMATPRHNTAGDLAMFSCIYVFIILSFSISFCIPLAMKDDTALRRVRRGRQREKVASDEEG